ncbi:MAG: cytochrome c oxidase subunit II [Bacteroidota bacterium]
MSPAPTQHVETVDFVMLYIVGISVILLIGITIAMVYFVFKYNRKKGHQPVDIHGNIWLEVVWIAIPTILVLSMFYYGYTGFREYRDVPANAYVIKATARMWAWEFNYDNGKKIDTLYVPQGVPIKVELISQDVNHSLYIPAFRIKEDVIVGRTNYLAFTAKQTGSYDIACAEYCGLNHSMMYSKVKVLPENEFYAWLNVKTDSTSN